MSDEYTNRCKVLAQWLSIREVIGAAKDMHKNMSNVHPNYSAYVNRLEDLRNRQTKMTYEHPWLDRVLSELGKGI
jgi:hypothetical protein